MVIDDEETMRDSCTQVLTKEGYRVEVASDGRTGLSKTQEMALDLALVDLKMPGMGGMEILEAIREMDPTIVPIVITGYATVTSAVEAMKRGAYDFLPKPFTPDELRLVVKRGLEKRRLEQETAALRAEKERMKRNFVTLVSHELRSPLVAVEQYLAVLGEGILDEEPAKQKKVLSRVRERVKELLTLVHEWLDISRIEAGRIVEKFEPLDLGTVLDEAAERMRGLAEPGRITIEISVPDDPGTMEGDREALNHLFGNLIGNAIKYNREEGRVHIRLEEDENDFVATVSDTGVGIPPEGLPFIFDEFFRVKTRETRKLTGSGLGLSLVKKIVEAHKGRIKVSSELGQGTTFTVILPKHLS
ncbi:MAG: response regulator [Candidatus Latescibacteria bacterium]|nr:response regulator [Candidatus Latescibacterota bacterium]MCK5525938.1 response regulator [Candidatus Latescibacterota bacterium]